MELYLKGMYRIPGDRENNRFGDVNLHSESWHNAERFETCLISAHLTICACNILAKADYSFIYTCRRAADSSTAAVYIINLRNFHLLLIMLSIINIYYSL